MADSSPFPKRSHELGTTTVAAGRKGRHGRLIRVHGLIDAVVVWTCEHAHRSRQAAYDCAVAERDRREGLRV